MNTNNTIEINVGVDTSKMTLDFHILPSNKVFHIKNNQTGITKAIARLLKLHTTRVVIEATGRMEKLLMNNGVGPT